MPLWPFLDPRSGHTADRMPREGDGTVVKGEAAGLVKVALAEVTESRDQRAERTAEAPRGTDNDRGLSLFGGHRHFTFSQRGYFAKYTHT